MFQEKGFDIKPFKTSMAVFGAQIFDEKIELQKCPSALLETNEL